MGRSGRRKNSQLAKTRQAIFSDQFVFLPEGREMSWQEMVAHIQKEAIRNLRIGDPAALEFIDNIVGQPLFGLNLQRKNFPAIKIMESDLGHNELVDALITDNPDDRKIASDLQMTVFQETELRDSDLSYCQFDDSRFVGALLENLRCQSASFLRTAFAGTDDELLPTPTRILRSQFRESDFRGLKLFPGTELVDNLFENCQFSDEAELWGVVFDRSRFQGIDWHRPNFYRNKMIASQFVDCTLLQPSFREADLAEIAFRSEDRDQQIVLDQADFQRSSLVDARFENVFLEKVDFSGAELDRAQFEDCQFFTKAEGSVLWTDTVFRNCYLQDVDFAADRFVDVRFEGCQFDGCSWPEDQQGIDWENCQGL